MSILTFSEAGIYPLSQYTFLLILAINPALFRLFKPRHFFLIALGILGSFINARAMLPFMLLTILDLDYSKLEKKEMFLMLGFFVVQVWIVLSFGSAWYG